MSQQPFNSDGGFSTTGNITVGNILIAGTIEPSGSASPAPSLNGFLNIDAVGNITAGNVLTDGYYYANGAPFSGGTNYGDSNVATFLANYGSNTVSTTGNITAGNFVGSGSNVDIVAGSYDWTFVNDGNLVLPGNTFAVKYANGTAVSLGGNYGNSNVVSLLSSFGSNTISTTGNVTAGNFIGNISITGNVTGTSANVDLVAGAYTWSFNNTGNLVLPGNTFAVNYANGTAVSLGGSSYGNSNVVTLLSSFGSNTVSTTGNITTGNLLTAGNIAFTANTSQINFNTGAYISGNGAPISREGSIVLSPYTGAGSTFPGVVIGGAGRLIAPNGSVHQIFNTSDVTTQVASKITVGTAASSTSTGALQVTGGAGVTGNIYAGGLLNVTGNITGGNLISSATIFGNPDIILGNIANASATKTRMVTDTTFSYIQTGNGTVGSTGNIVFSPYSSSTQRVVIDTSSGNITTTGNVITPNRPAFRVYGNGNTVNLNNTVNTTGNLNINNFAVDYNQGSYLDTSTGVFTAPVAGLYQVNLVARVSSNNNATSQIAVMKNGSTQQAFWEVAANSTVGHMGVSSISKLAVGDTLVAKVLLGTINFDSNDSWSVAFIG